MRKIVLALVFVALFPACVFAYSFSVAYDATDVFNTTALTGYSTTGGMMAGMTVTANGQSSATWTTTNNNGIASNSDFSLSLNGDSFISRWKFNSTLTINSILIDAGAGNAVFDTIAVGEYSPGSSIGLPFRIAFGSTGDYHINATYSGAVQVDGVLYGDLYRYLTLDFTSGGFLTDDTLFFRADTDSLSIDGDIDPVPEPATFLLLGGGLAGLAFYRRKRK